jgi:hypothetical protein
VPPSKGARGGMVGLSEAFVSPKAVGSGHHPAAIFLDPPRYFPLQTNKFASNGSQGTAI